MAERPTTHGDQSRLVPRQSALAPSSAGRAIGVCTGELAIVGSVTVGTEQRAMATPLWQ
jgi:hypothetical protein